MEIAAPYVYIYQISLYCPLSLHTYLIMWDEMVNAERSVDEGPSIYIDEDIALKTYSQTFPDLRHHILHLNKIGCIDIVSATIDSLYVTLQEVDELTLFLEETEEGLQHD